MNRVILCWLLPVGLDRAIRKHLKKMEQQQQQQVEEEEALAPQTKKVKLEDPIQFMSANIEWVKGSGDNVPLLIYDLIPDLIRQDVPAGLEHKCAWMYTFFPLKIGGGQLYIALLQTRKDDRRAIRICENDDILSSGAGIVLTAGTRSVRACGRRSDVDKMLQRIMDQLNFYYASDEDSENGERELGLTNIHRGKYIPEIKEF